MQRRWRKKILTTFEIKEKVKIVPITFVIVEEVEEFEEIVKKQRDLSGIWKLVQ
jgi:energy-converting hydrogenase A subunit M